MPKVESYGFKPTLGRRAIRIFCKTIIGLLRLNGRSKFSNEFIQLLDPKIEIKFEDQTLRFRTGNGRLLWRAKTILTEEPLMISWIQSLSSDDIVLDIGSNVGMYAVPIAKKVQTVYACELDPLNIAILKENLFLRVMKLIRPLEEKENYALLEKLDLKEEIVLKIDQFGVLMIELALLLCGQALLIDLPLQQE